MHNAILSRNRTYYHRHHHRRYHHHHHHAIGIHEFPLATLQPVIPIHVPILSASTPSLPGLGRAIIASTMNNYTKICSLFSN